MTESIPITATVRGIELGRARPEIIVPLVGDDHDAVMEQAAAAVATPARIIEWRIDLFRPDLDDAEDHRDVVLATLPRLRAALGPDRALLATVRTSAGGRRPADPRHRSGRAARGPDGGSGAPARSRRST